jgi:oxygen-independent coproporphyrinogen III oxidase
VAKGYLVTEDDKIRREVIMRVMCDLSLDFMSVGERFGINFYHYFARELESLAEMERDGMIRLTPSGFEVTTRGRLLIRNIAMRFDASQTSETEKRYSRTI